MSKGFLSGGGDVGLPFDVLGVEQAKTTWAATIGQDSGISKSVSCSEYYRLALCW